MKSRLLIISLSSLIASLASAQTVSYDFNDSDTLTNDFSFDTNSDAAYSAGNGLNSSGAIANSSGSNNRFTAVTSADPLAFSTGSNFSLTQSVFFQTTSGNATAGNDAPVVLGLTGVANEVDRGNAAGFGAPFVHSSILKDITTGDLNYRVFTTSDGFFDDFSSGFALETSTWYQFRVTYDFDSSGGTWTTTSVLDEANSDGSLVVGGNIVSFTSPAQSNSFTNSDDIYGFFASTGGTDFGVAYYDNAVLATAAVPEPSSYALIAGLLGLMSIMVRRRR